MSKLIYHNRVFNIETNKPYGGEEVLRKYLLNELDKLKRFFDSNLEFYKFLAPTAPASITSILYVAATTSN